MMWVVLLGAIMLLTGIVFPLVVSTDKLDLWQIIILVCSMFMGFWWFVKLLLCKPVVKHKKRKSKKC